MKRSVTASLLFIQDSSDSKPPFGINVYNMMSENLILFPDMPVTITFLQTISNDLLAANAAALTGDHAAGAHRTNVEKIWNENFRKTANYVTLVANNDETVIKQAGFGSTKGETTPTPPPNTPIEFDVSPVKAKGEADVSCSKGSDGDAFNYIAKTLGANVEIVDNCIKITMGNESVYVYLDTHKKLMLTGLASHVPVEVCMMAVNRAGTSPATSWQQVTPQ